MALRPSVGRTSGPTWRRYGRPRSYFRRYPPQLVVRSGRAPRPWRGGCSGGRRARVPAGSVRTGRPPSAKGSASRSAAPSPAKVGEAAPSRSGPLPPGAGLPPPPRRGARGEAKGSRVDRRDRPVGPAAPGRPRAPPRCAARRTLPGQGWAVSATRAPSVKPANPSVPQRVRHRPAEMLGQQGMSSGRARSGGKGDHVETPAGRAGRRGSGPPPPRPAVQVGAPISRTSVVQGAAAAQPLELAVFDHPQHLLLHPKRGGGDLVQEQGAAVGAFEPADLALGGAGEGAPRGRTASLSRSSSLSAAQLTAHERTVPALREVVQPGRRSVPCRCRARRSPGSAGRAAPARLTWSSMSTKAGASPQRAGRSGSISIGGASWLGGIGQRLGEFQPADATAHRARPCPNPRISALPAGWHAACWIGGQTDLPMEDGLR